MKEVNKRKIIYIFTGVLQSLVGLNSELFANTCAVIITDANDDTN